ncbi:MAG: hypothetical protein PX481_16650, partial [Microcystis sp. M53603_WE2]|nr:hypothetical protein [Microcystis sp. M53603_WE2]
MILDPMEGEWGEGRWEMGEGRWEMGDGTGEMGVGGSRKKIVVPPYCSSQFRCSMSVIIGRITVIFVPFPSSL